MLSENNGTISREELNKWATDNNLCPVHMVLSKTPIVPSHYTMGKCFRYANYKISDLIPALKSYITGKNNESNNLKEKLISYLESIN